MAFRPVLQLLIALLPLALGACVVVEAPPSYYGPGPGAAAGAALGGLVGAAIAESSADFGAPPPTVLPYPPGKLR